MVLMACPYLQVGFRRVELSQVKCVAMSHAGRIKSFTVVVDGTRTVDDFIASVSVYISYTQVVVALSRIVFPFGLVTIEEPALVQLLPVPVEGGERSTCIISPAHDYTGMHSVQVSDASQITVASVGTRVSPVLQVSTRRDIINGLHGFSG